MDKVELSNAPGAGSTGSATRTASPRSKKRSATVRSRTKAQRRGVRPPRDVKAEITTPIPTDSAAPAKYFHTISLYPARDPIGLHFEYDEDSRGKMELPAILFHRECEVAALRVSDTITDKKIRKEILESLLSAAQLGLGGPSPNLDEGKQYFEFFKMRVVRAAEDRRSLWVKEILQKSAYILIVALLAIEFWAFATGLGVRRGAQVFKLEDASADGVLNVAIKILGILGFALLGAIGGNLFFVLLRGRNVTYDNFDRLNPYRFRVNLYLTYLVLLVLVALLTLAYKIVTVGVGALVLNDFVTDVPLAIVVGLVCALAEATLATLIQGKVEGMASPADKVAPAS